MIGFETIERCRQSLSPAYGIFGLKNSQHLGMGGFEQAEHSLSFPIGTSAAGVQYDILPPTTFGFVSFGIRCVNRTCTPLLVFPNANRHVRTRAAGGCFVDLRTIRISRVISCESSF